MNPNPQTPQANQGTGALVGSLIIVLILLVLGAYFLTNTLNEQKEKAAESQKIQQENQQNAALLESIEQQLSVPEPNYVGGFQANPYATSSAASSSATTTE